MPSQGNNISAIGISQSRNRPKPRALAPTVRMYRVAVRPPRAFHMVVNDAALVAGPAIRNARAAPGEPPMCINPAAMGTDAVAQT